MRASTTTSIAFVLLSACGGGSTAPSSTAPSSPPTAPSDPTLATVDVIGDRDVASELWIDGSLRGPLVGEQQIQLAPGRHLLESRRDGELVGSATIEAAAGQQGWISLLTIEEPVVPRVEPAPEAPRAPGRVDLPTTVRESGDGEFDPGVVVRLITSREPAIRACYERALAASPGLTASLTITMMAEETGSVARVHVLEGSLGATADACLVDVVEHFRFSPGPYGAPMTYELVLGFAPAP